MRTALTICLLLLLALLCGSAATLHLWAPGVVKPPLYRALLLGQQASPWLVWVSGLAALAVLFLMTQLSRPGFTLLWRSGSAAVLLSLVSLGVALPWWGDLLQGPIKRAAEVARQRPEPAVQWGLHQPSFAVYREEEAPRRAPRDGELALVRLDQLPAQMAQVGGRFSMLYAERGYGLILWRASAAPAEPSVAQAPVTAP